MIVLYITFLKFISNKLQVNNIVEDQDRNNLSTFESQARLPLILQLFIIPYRLRQPSLYHDSSEITTVWSVLISVIIGSIFLL